MILDQTLPDQTGPVRCMLSQLPMCVGEVIWTNAICGCPYSTDEGRAKSYAIQSWKTFMRNDDNDDARAGRAENNSRSTSGDN